MSNRLGPAALLVVLAAMLPDAGGAAPSPLALEPCRVPGLEEDVRCGTLQVIENRETGAGRRIPIPVVVVPARGAASRDPIVFIAGGPGDSSIASVPGISQVFAADRAQRDLLFVDTRGTGGPGALRCDELIRAGSLQGFLSHYLPPAEVRACRQRLEKSYDLGRYTTDAAADDLDEVRAALGYERLNLIGVSYGTRLALVYLRRHPAATRTVTLVGVVPTDDRAPLYFASDAQAALDATFADCAADAACGAAFPKLAEEFAAVIARLDQAPAEVQLSDPSTGPEGAKEGPPLSLTHAGFAQAIRYMLYTPVTAVLVPLYVHQAAAGNFRPVAETAQMFVGSAAHSLADGYYLSVTCAEDVPFIREPDIAAATAGTFLGDFRIRQQQAACAEWPVPPVAAAFLEPVTSSVPVLIFSGENDPVTPARDGHAVARTLTNSLHLVIPEGGHGFDGMQGADCPDRLFSKFVDAGKLEGLDTACVAGMQRSPFITALPGADAPRLSAAELQRFAGHYVAAEGFEFEIVLAGDRLRLEMGGRGPMFISPLAATRFGIDGLPPGYALAFEIDPAGAVTAVVLEEGVGTKTRLAKKP